MDWHSGMNILLLLHTKTDVSFRALGTLVYSFLPLIERCQLAIVFPPGVVVFALNLMNSSEVSARASWFVLGLKNKIPSPPLPSPVSARASIADSRTVLWIVQCRRIDEEL
jgi:hypothetical protein